MKLELDVIEKYNMLPRGTKVLCAVSGGADSMCLLHLLWSRRGEYGIELAAAHYEHGIRGDESLRDAAFVERWCRERGIECLVGHGDAPAFARERGMSLEEAARELRYAFLQSAAERLGCGRIATAHNLDDNAETMIFNLCRGTGAAGLCGIPPVRGNIIRPLLHSEREAIELYLAENGIAHVEDSTNQTDDNTRCLIRHSVMPALRAVNGRISCAAGRTAELLREDERCLAAMADGFIDRFFDGESIPQREFRGLDRAVAVRVIRKLCGRSLSLAHVEAALSLAEGSGLAFADLPGQRLCRERGRIYFSARQSAALPERSLCTDGVTRIPELGLRLYARVSEQPGEINGLFKTYCFNYENICGSIICTGRKNGDKLRVLGRGCTKSLKALFAERGMTRSQRDETLVLRDEAGILAVVGLAVAERCAAAPGEKILRIDIERE